MTQELIPPDTEILTCPQCSKPFEYPIKTVKARRPLCPACRAAGIKKSLSAARAKIKLRNGEFAASHKTSSIHRVSVMTQEDAAVHLAFWEELERLMKNPKATEADLERLAENPPKPIRKQTVQLLERRALAKIAAALSKEYADYATERDGGQKFSLSTPIEIGYFGTCHARTPQSES